MYKLRACGVSNFRPTPKAEPVETDQTDRRIIFVLIATLRSTVAISLEVARRRAHACDAHRNYCGKTTRPPQRFAKPTQPRPPTVYDCSHMKMCKRTAHKKRVELAEKRAVLRSRREQLGKNLRRKAEREIDVLKRLETRLRHEAKEKQAWRRRSEGGNDGRRKAQFW
ncbi:hypothetical protein B0H13DRAFT_1902999 [Mycena leptocephala]|nr:hypothetical protein B0H13DRAFT_1902999 [Mycena leptocephala]